MKLLDPQLDYYSTLPNITGWEDWVFFWDWDNFLDLELEPFAEWEGLQ
jgi:hypothetical protein